MNKSCQIAPPVTTLQNSMVAEIPDLSPQVTLRIYATTSVMQSTKPLLQLHQPCGLLFIWNGLSSSTFSQPTPNYSFCCPSASPSVSCESSLYVSLPSTLHSSAACSSGLPQHTTDERQVPQSDSFIPGTILPALGPDDTSIWRKTYKVTQCLHALTDSSPN